MLQIFIDPEQSTLILSRNLPVIGLLMDAVLDKEVRSNGQRGRYLKLVATSAADNRPWTSSAEIQIIGGTAVAWHAQLGRATTYSRLNTTDRRDARLALDIIVAQD